MTQKCTVGRTLTRDLPATAVMARAWPALLLATVCLLPFLNKAFLIDDPHFLMMARQIIKHPLHPLDFATCWNIAEVCEKPVLSSGNVLMGYALVPTVLAGSVEWVAHLTQLIFAWIAIVAMSSLVLRFGWSRIYATVGALLLVALPPFLPMASTAMPDTLAATLGLVGMERLAAWKAEGKWRQGVAAAVALGLAGLARLHLGLLLPLGGFYLLEGASPSEALYQMRRRLWIWTPVIGGAVLSVAVLLAIRERSMGINVRGFSGAMNIPGNLRAYFLYLAFPLPLAACWAATRWKTGPRRLAVVLAAAAGAGGAAPSPFRMQVFLAVAGLGVSIDLLVESWRKWDHEGIFLSLWLLVPLPIAYYGHLPIKYLLPCAPALILICFRFSASVPVRLARAAGVFLVLAGTGYSLLILRSDAEFANFGRTAINRLIRPHVAAGETVWYGGHFSSYWYAPGAGAALSVPAGSQPKRGDLFAVGAFEGAFELRRLPNRTLVESISHTYSFGRTMGAGMGLYTNRTGAWLWGFGRSDWDRYELWRID